MRILLKSEYEGVGVIAVTLSHDNKVENCKQWLNTKLAIQADSSIYMTPLTGVNEEGAWLNLELQGIEAIGLIEVLHTVTGALLNAIKNTNYLL
jgi:hypothetical protein